MVPLDVLLSKLGYGTFSSVAHHALADQVSKAGLATLCQINSISEQQGFLACSFSLRWESLTKFAHFGCSDCWLQFLFATLGRGRSCLLRVLVLLLLRFRLCRQ